MIGGVVHARRDVAGLDDDHPDAEVPELEVQRLGQCLQRVLRCGIDPFEGCADTPLHRADVDQDAAPPLPPSWGDRLDHPQGAEGIDIEHPDDVLEREVLQGAPSGDSRIVDHGVELPGCVHCGEHGVGALHIEAENLFDLQVPQCRDIAGRGHHLMTTLGEHLRGSPAN